MLTNLHPRAASPFQRAASVIVGLTLLAAAVLLALYGLFALLYGGDSGSGDTYVELFGTRLDAHWVGAVVLVIAVCVAALAIALLRRKRERPLGE